ncbi:hypothetical protein Tco_0696756 [Tanacetum coccineum]
MCYGVYGNLNFHGAARNIVLVAHISKVAHEAEHCPVEWHLGRSGSGADWEQIYGGIFNLRFTPIVDGGSRRFIWRGTYNRRNTAVALDCVKAGRGGRASTVDICDHHGGLAINTTKLADADWAIVGPYFCDFVMRESDIPGWVCNGVRFGVITLYDSMGVSVEETREWWSDIRIAFKTRIPQYLRDWGILEAKCIDPETYNIKFDVGKDVPLQGDAYGDCGCYIEGVHKYYIYLF